MHHEAARLADAREAYHLGAEVARSVGKDIGLNHSYVGNKVYGSVGDAAKQSVFDMAKGMGMDLAGAIAEKMDYNDRREDHKAEARLAPGGKKY